MKSIRPGTVSCVLGLAFCFQVLGQELVLDKPVEVRGGRAILKTLVSLPRVENDYSKRFRFDSFDNPKLAELRRRYRLDEVIEPGTDEFDRQVRLMDWTHRQFKRFGQPSTPTRGALEVLDGVGAGHRFFCAQYGQVLVSAAASLGWVDRLLALRRHQGANRVGGSTEHTTTEIWSNQYRKWVMLDPTSNLYVERDGVPLNAWEIRQEWFHREGKDLVFVVGQDRNRYRKAELPIVLRRFEGFGDLTFEPDEPDKYGFIGYIPNTDLMDNGLDYGGMFITKDSLCAGTSWHTRDLPPHPATDPYFPMGQSDLSLVAREGRIIVEVRTLTPNFRRFEARQGGGEWRLSEDRFTWDVQRGTHRLEVRTVNAFGVTGPVSLAEVFVDE
jgi:hypothetical protein